MHHPQFASNEEESCFILRLFAILSGRPPEELRPCQLLETCTFNTGTSVDPHYLSLRYLFLPYSISATLSVSAYYLLTPSWLLCLGLFGAIKRRSKAALKRRAVFFEVWLHIPALSGSWLMRCTRSTQLTHFQNKDQ